MRDLRKAGKLVLFLAAAAARPALADNLATGSGACDTPTTPFCDAMMKPTPGWGGHVFRLAQEYPAAVPEEDKPWLKFDPRTQSLDYIKAALAYFYDGNVRADTESSFDPALNSVRRWYNAPWQDTGKNGREFIHGLTRERVTPPKELDPAQTRKWNNYAVGFYNAPGALTIGKIWTDHGKPDPSLAHLPEGTVAAKLLFTTAPVEEAPYLKGSPEWDAYVYADPQIETRDIPDDESQRKRAVMKVRLLQIDIAVKDSRATSTTGWVMGTFVYGGGPGGPAGSGWENVAPIGVMWGNDPGLKEGAEPAEGTLNPAVKMQHVGYQGRLNGPVDNKVSSCLSCHSTAEVWPTTPAKMGSSMIPDPAAPAKWFRNIPSGTPFDPGFRSTDYSLQISLGISNFREAAKLAEAKGPEKQKLLRELKLEEQLSPREGGRLD